MANEIRFRNQVVYKRKISSLCAMNIQTPMWQRFLDPTRVEYLFGQMMHYYAESQQLPPQFGIILGFDTDKQYHILDGQHRFFAFQKFYHETQQDFDVLVICCALRNSDERFQLCRIVNDAVPFSMPAQANVQLVAKELVRFMEQEYELAFSRALRPRRPNFRPSALLDQLSWGIGQQTETKTYQQWQEEIMRLNTFLSQQPWKFFRYPHDSHKTLFRLLKLCDKKKCYFGMYKHFEWIELLFKPKDEVKTPIQIDSVRTPLSQKERLMVWDHEIGGNARDGLCFVCSSPIKLENFECGHVIPVQKGGTNSLSNLKAVCQKCNRSCGTTNLLEFKKRVEHMTLE